MSGKFPFAADQSSILQENSPGWSDQTLDYSDAASSLALTDSISESYVTAVGDNETHYLSVLETTGEVTLEDLQNLTLSSSKGNEQNNMIFNENGVECDNDKLNVIDLGDQQVVIFTVDGSNDLYGIQMAQDEDGNLQKYQFKFRSTEDGQIEAVPDSFQLIPDDENCPENNEQLLLNDIEPEHFIQNDEDQEENIINFALETQEDNGENTVESEHVYIKGERHSPDLHSEIDPHLEPQAEHNKIVKTEQHIDKSQHYEESENESSDEFQENGQEDVKAGILLLQSNSESITPNIKQEMMQEEFEGYTTEYSADEFQQIEHDQMEENLENGDICQESEMTENGYMQINENAEETAEHYQENQEEIPTDEEDDCITYQIETATDDTNEYQQREEDSQENEEDNRVVSMVQELVDQEHYEKVFVRESHITHMEEQEKNCDGNIAGRVEFGDDGDENDSDNEEYQIVDGLHITGDLDSQNDSESQTTHSILQEVLEKPVKSGILKNSMMLRNSKKDGKLYYCIYKYPEKENVNSLTDENIFKPVKINPRSILKSSFIAREKKAQDDEKSNKRFARNKEAVQAKLFQNFISKTTIPYAPERRTRLPRKQEIKPVDERRDAEIIVQEVLVSPSGFVEDVAARLKNKDKLRVTAIVELSDSEDETSNNGENRRRGSHSDSDVIEINSDSESEVLKQTRGRPKKSDNAKDMENQPDILKRRRGRPPKTAHANAVAKNGESPSKKSRTDSDSESDRRESEVEPEKKEIQCPNCTKTFPSQNSLNTHIQHHNLENKLRNSQKAVVEKASNVSKIEYKYQCDKCDVTFKNRILLSRHVCAKKTAEVSCGVCLKRFKNSSVLETHKKVHVKENLAKSTNVAKVPPKRSIIPRFSSITKPAPPATYKCRDCSKVCPSQFELTAHSKTHKKFTCTNCSATFSSRILLDTHVRLKCVKPKSPASKRLSYKVTKSFIASPRKSKIPKSNPALNSTAADAAMNTSSIFNIECETCGQKFTMYRSLYAHKAQKHGMETPDKSLLEKPKKLSYKPKATHGGIPANEKLKRAFAELRMKLEIDQSMVQCEEAQE